MALCCGWSFLLFFLLVIGVFLDIDFSVDFGGNAGTGLMIQLKAVGLISSCSH